MSSTTATPVGGFPISDFATALDAELLRVRDAPAWSLPVEEQAKVIGTLARARAGLDELLLRVLVAGDRNDVAALTAATSTTAWLAHATVSPPGAAHADVRLAAALDGSCEATRRALAGCHRCGPGAGDRPRPR